MIKDTGNQEDPEEWTTETANILFDMGHVDLNRTAEECFLKDINTKKPILQIGSQTFSGQIHQNIGSIFFFDDEFQQSHRINRVVKFRKDKTDDTNETTAGGAATSST